MNRPALYSRASEVQRFDAAEIINEFEGLLKANADTKKTLLDVGTGSGDVLVEILIPALAQDFTRITGVDISPKFVDFSSRSYSNHKGLDFKVLNIETEHLPKEFHNQFDRVTSFYTLQWIKNPRLSLENIYTCLRRNGDCLLVFLGSHSVFNVFKSLQTDPRWEHLTKTDQITSPLLDDPDIGEKYKALLEEAGFVDIKLEVKEKMFVYKSLDSYKYNMKAVNPFGLSDAEYDEYFVAMSQCMKEMGLREKIPGTEDYMFYQQYRLVVAYARKGE